VERPDHRIEAVLGDARAALKNPLHVRQCLTLFQPARLARVVRVVESLPPPHTPPVEAPLCEPEARSRRTVDVLDQLDAVVRRDGPVVGGQRGPKAHPALVEARQLKIALARLFGALRLPDGAVGDESRDRRRVGVRGTYGIGGTT
jgi:hypothetical protein